MTGIRGMQTGLLVSGVGSFVLIGASLALYGPSLPAYLRDFGLSPATAAGIISAHWIGALIGVALMVARVHVSARRSLLVMAAGAALLGWQPAWWAMLAGAMLVGIGYGLISVLYNRYFLIGFGSRGAAMVGVLNATFGLGAICGPLVLVALGNRPAAAFAVLAVAALLALPLAAPQPEPEALPDAPPEPLRFNPVLILGTLALSCEAANVGFGPTGLIARGLSEVAATALSSAFFAAFLLSRAALYWIAPRLGAFPLLVTAASGVGLCALGAAVLAPGPFYVLGGVFTGLLFPSYFVCASAVMGQGPRAASMVIGAGLLGGILTPVWMGAILSLTGAGALFGLIAVFALTTAALMLTVLRPGAPA